MLEGISLATLPSRSSPGKLSEGFVPLIGLLVGQIFTVHFHSSDGLNGIPGRNIHATYVKPLKNALLIHRIMYDVVIGTIIS